MYEVIYLEPDAEITSVINRLKKNEKEAIALVVPRGATLAQSIVNLKLLKRSAEDIGKKISIISTDKISRNLASQIGLAVFSKVIDAEKATPELPEKKSETSDGEYKVNNYYSRKEAEAEPEVVDENLDEDSVEVDRMTDPTDEDYDAEEEDLKAEVRKGLDRAEDEEEEEEFDDEEEQEIVPASQTESPREALKEKTDKNLKKENKQPEQNIKEEREEDSKESEKKPKSRLKKFLIGFSVSIIIFLLIGAYVYIPTVNAKVLLKTEDVKFEKEVTVQKDLKESNSKDMVVPGVLVEVEKDFTGTFNSTGQKDVGTKATGKITISNSFSQDSFVLPKGSRLISGGKTFISDVDVSVPGGTWAGQIKPGTVDIAVTADKSGEDYNIAAANFTITSLASDKQKYITGKSSAAMTGGTTKQVKFVSDKDLSDAEASLLEQAKKSPNVLSDQAQQNNQVIFADSIKNEVVLSSSTKKEDEEADVFDCTIKVRYYAMGYRSDDLSKVIADSLQNIMGDNKMVINPEKTKTEAVLVSSDVDSGIEKIKVSGKYKLGNKISDQAVIEKIKGKKIGSAKMAAESIDGIGSVVITVKPSIIKQVPFLKNHIKVQFDYAGE